MALPVIYAILPSKFDRAYGDQQPVLHEDQKVMVNGNILSLREHLAKLMACDIAQHAIYGSLPATEQMSAMLVSLAAEEKQALIDALESTETEQPDWSPKESNEDLYKTVAEVLSKCVGMIPEAGPIMSGSLDYVIGLKYGTEAEQQKAYLDQSFAELHSSIDKSANRVIEAVSGMFTNEVLADAAAHIQGVKELLQRYRLGGARNDNKENSVPRDMLSFLKELEWDENKTKDYARTQDVVRFLHDEVYKPSNSLQSWVLKLDSRMTVKTFEDIFPVLIDTLALQIECYVFLINIQLRRSLAAATFSDKGAQEGSESAASVARDAAEFFNRDANNLICDLADLRKNRAEMIARRATILINERKAAVRQPVYVERPGKVKNEDVTMYIWQVRDTYSDRLWEISSDDLGSSYAGKDHFKRYGKEISQAAYDWLRLAAPEVLQTKLRGMAYVHAKLIQPVSFTPLITPEDVLDEGFHFEED